MQCKFLSRVQFVRLRLAATSVRSFASNATLSGSIILRPPSLADVTAIHSLVRDSGLDINSPYAYTLGASHWRDTSIIAHCPSVPDANQQSKELNNSLVGFVQGYIVPQRPDTYFVWQVATSSRFQGCGHATNMVSHLLWKHARQSGIRYLEATVTPDNLASQSLFNGVANKLDCPCEVTKSFYPANNVVEPPMKDEDLYRIGPFSRENLEAYMTDQGLLPLPSPGSSASSYGDRKACTLIVRDLADVDAAGNYKRGSRAKWESRRYLTRQDGFGFSFHHTVMYKDQPSFQWYRNHTESVYITQGYGTIEIVERGSPEDFERFIGTGVTYELYPGVMYALRGEKHILTARSEGGMHCQCVFNPPVTGTEDHNESGAYPAVDDDGKQHYEFTSADVPRLFKPPAALQDGSF